MSGKRGPRQKKHILVLIPVLIFFAFLTMLNQSLWSGTSIRTNPETVWSFENPWLLTEEDSGVTTQLTLPIHMQLEKGKLYTMSTVLEYDGTQVDMPYGFLHVDHLYCRVLLDGEVLFSCMPEDLEKRDNSKSVGFVYSAFQLPHDCRGKTLEVQLLPTIDSPISYDLPDLKFANFTSSLRATIIRDVPHDVITILCILLGIVTILFTSFTLEGASYREGISIGIFSLVFALYLMTECKLNAYFIGNPYYLYLLNYTAFSLLPISLMGFMRERLLEKHRKLCTAVIVGECLFFLTEMVLHFRGIMDLREILPTVHVIYFGEMLLVIGLILRMKDRKKRMSLSHQITPVLIGMIVDAFIYWNHWEIGSNDATFTIIGVIVFLVIELSHAWKSSVCIYTQSVRTDVYRQMAYVDELTGAGNRRAFDLEIERIVNREITYCSMIVASADVNKLKYVNDHFGHAAGDTLIRTSAQIMIDAVGDCGKVFRTGGDEFCVFLYDVDGKDFHNMVDKANEEILRFNAGSKFPISIAVGYSQIADNKILEAVQDADERMYDNKVKSKMQRDDPVEGVYITKE